MKIELKKINHSKSLSEETPAYSAQVYVDGVHVCDVSNHGTGGPDMQRPARGTDHKDLAALDAKIKATYPKQTYDFGDGKKGEYETDLELLCHLLLDRADLEKTVRRDLSKKVMFVKPADGKLYGVKLTHPSHRDAAIKAVKERHGIAKTVNEMTLDEAVKVYESATA